MGAKARTWLRIASLQLRMNADIAIGLAVTVILMGILAVLDFSLFEGVVDIYCIGCCFVVYAFAVNTSRISDDPTSGFLAPTFLFIGLIDAAYALSRRTPGGSDSSLYLWASSAWFNCAAFFLLSAAAIGSMSKRRTYTIFISIAAAVASIWILGFRFPALMSRNFLIFSLLDTACLGFFYSAAIRRLHLRIPEGRYRRRLIASCILSFLAFPFMMLFPLLGISVIFIAQFFRMVSYYLVYKAIVSHALMKPYRRMFGDLERNNLRLESLNRELQGALEEKTVLLKEIHHRVKNNLQIISSLLNLEAKHSGNPEQAELFKPSQDRVRSMALIHEMLYESPSLTEIELGAYANRLLIAMRDSFPGPVRLDTELETVALPLERTLPCGLALNEILMNAVKYGLAGSAAPRIGLRIKTERNGDGRSLILMEVEDEGPGLPEDLDPETTSSLGFSLIRNLTRQLEGSVSWSALRDEPGRRGLLVRISFPSDRPDRFVP